MIIIENCKNYNVYPNIFCYDSKLCIRNIVKSLSIFWNNKCLALNRAPVYILYIILCILSLDACT